MNLQTICCATWTVHCSIQRRLRTLLPKPNDITALYIWYAPNYWCCKQLRVHCSHVNSMHTYKYIYNCFQQNFMGIEFGLNGSTRQSKMEGRRGRKQTKKSNWYSFLVSAISSTFISIDVEFKFGQIHKDRVFFF